MAWCPLLWFLYNSTYSAVFINFSSVVLVERKKCVSVSVHPWKQHWFFILLQCLFCVLFNSLWKHIQSTCSHTAKSAIYKGEVFVYKIQSSAVVDSFLSERKKKKSNYLIFKLWYPGDKQKLHLTQWQIFLDSSRFFKHWTPGEEDPGSIPALAARSLLVGSVSV